MGSKIRVRGFPARAGADVGEDQTWCSRNAANAAAPLAVSNSRSSVKKLGSSTAVAPSLSTGLRRCQAETFVQPAASQRPGRGPVVLTLDDDLRITSRTAASQSWLDKLLPPRLDERGIPASVYNVAAQLLAVEVGVDQHRPSARVHLADGFWLTLRAARLGSERSGPGAVVVTIEEASAAERLELFARACGLTARENELLGRLATGDDTRAMARQMSLSEHTVQDHLKAIFAKTGAHDRITVLSRALGTRNVAPDSRVGG
jgi:DNA-binding CsgD family transcriptional regulator